MRKRIALLAVAGVLVVGPARADYVVKDGNGVLQTVKSGTVGGGIQPVMSPVDASGNPFGVSNNPVYTAFGTGVLLPQFASAAHFICDSGCSGGGGGSSYTVTFGNAIGTLGTPGGFKDASGNFQSLLGDTTNGLWVNIKSSASLGVTGTFWQTTQPISAASLPLPSGAATQTTLASVLTALGSPFQAEGSIGNTSFGITGVAGTPTMSSVTVGTSSGTLLAASTFSNFLKVCVPLTAANGIWVRWDGGTAAQNSPSEYMPPGQCDSWVKSTGFLPTSTITAIASASVAVSVNGN